MFLIVLSSIVGLVCGLCGWVRRFAIGFALIVAMCCAALIWDYLYNIQPFFDKGQGDDGRGIGFGILLTYISGAGIGAVVAFCFGWVINIFLRRMDWF